MIHRIKSVETFVVTNSITLSHTRVASRQANNVDKIHSNEQRIAFGDNAYRVHH